MVLGLGFNGPSFGRARNPQTTGKSREISGISRTILLQNDFPDFPLLIFRASGAGHFQKSFQGAGALPPARPPDAPWRPRRDGASGGACLKCRGAPPPPRGAGCPENTSLGTIARSPRLIFREISCPENPAPSSARNSGQWLQENAGFSGCLGNPGI